MKARWWMLACIHALCMATTTGSTRARTCQHTNATRSCVRAHTYTHTQVCPLGRDTIQTRIYQIFLAQRGEDISAEFSQVVVNPEIVWRM